MHRFFGMVLTVVLFSSVIPPAQADTDTSVPTQVEPVMETPEDRPVPDYRLNRRLLGKNIKESSGLARSTFHPSVLWTHNDSSDSARIFAVGRRGHTRSIVRLGNAQNQDFEDIAAGRRHTLWVGDIGNDGRARARIQVYKVREPRRLVNRTKPVTRYDFAFEDGPRDAEALMVHPKTGRVYVVSKMSSGAAIYAAPERLRTGRVNTLRRIAEAPAGVTSGKFTPRGNGYFLTTYDAVLGYAEFDAEPVTVGKPPLRLGESLEVTRQGALLVGTEGPRSPVFAMSTPRLRTAPEPPDTDPAPTPEPDPVPSPTDQAGSYQLDRTITHAAITESSGLALSTYDPRLLWTHNDSGDSARIFGVSQSGAVQATLTLSGASARDWEDISAGPGHTLWVGDIGDNAEARTSIQVYKIAEPASATSATVPATRYTFAYPDGSNNAETLMVNPVTGRLYIVSKATDGGPGAIYEAPATLTASGTNKLTKVGTAPGRITAGDFAPDGTSFMIRTQVRGYLYASLTATPREIPLPPMQQGESLAYSTSPSHVYLGSERANSPVYRMATGQAGGDSTPTPTPEPDPVPEPDPTPIPEPDPAPEPPPTTAKYGPVATSAPSTAFVTPEQYGAKGDGTTDDASAMQRALDAAEGKTLWLPAGRTYNIGKTISVPSNTTVRGAGETSVIRFTWTGVNTPTSGGGSNIRSKGTTARNIHLVNFVLEGGGDGLPGGLKADNPDGLVPLLKLIKVDDFSVKRMELRKAEGLSISYTGSTNGVFQHNWVHHSGRDGITGYRNTSANVTDILVDSNLIEKVGDDAIAINGLVPGHDIPVPADGSNPLPKRITISNNVIRGWEDRQALGRGIALNGVAGVVVENNLMSHPNSTGILLTGCNSHICEGSSTDWSSTNAQLLNNTILYSTGGSRPGAITIIKTTNSVVRGNTAANSSPFDFSGCTGCTISGNTQ